HIAGIGIHLFAKSVDFFFNAQVCSLQCCDYFRDKGKAPLSRRLYLPKSNYRLGGPICGSVMTLTQDILPEASARSMAAPTSAGSVTNSPWPPKASTTFS